MAWNGANPSAMTLLGAFRLHSDVIALFFAHFSRISAPCHKLRGKPCRIRQLSRSAKRTSGSS